MEEELEICGRHVNDAIEQLEATGKLYKVSKNNLPNPQEDSRIQMKDIRADPTESQTADAIAGDEDDWREFGGVKGVADAFMLRSLQRTLRESPTKPMATSLQMDVFKSLSGALESNPRALKRIVNSYMVVCEVAKGIKLDESDDWPALSSKLIKWTCLCELYPYRMSLLVLTITDFQQKECYNRTVREHPLAKKLPFFKYYNKTDQGEYVETTGLSGQDCISIVFNRHVDRLVYSNALAEQMLHLDGDPEMFQLLLATPVPTSEGTAGSAVAEPPTLVDVTVEDVLNTMLDFSFNLNPALRTQLGGAMSELASESEMLQKVRVGGGKSFAFKHAISKGSISSKRSIVSGKHSRKSVMATGESVPVDRSTAPGRFTSQRLDGPFEDDDQSEDSQDEGSKDSQDEGNEDDVNADGEEDETTAPM
eukprot:5532000-Prymnesium_polylepis.3